VAPKTAALNDAMRNYVERLKADPEADWKTPIEFYGKVVDGDGRPVPGASIEFDWTTTALQGGCLKAEKTSDVDGLFSLIGQEGKSLGVSVRKPGYYSVESGYELTGFEYANPSSPRYYVANAGQPVVFHLLAKGLHAASLIHWKRDLSVDEKGQASLDLQTGQTASENSESLSIAVSKSRSTAGAFAWAATISVNGGEIQTHTDSFPFAAPSSGYMPNVEVNIQTAKPYEWQGYQGAAVYVKTPKGVGRYEIRMLLGKRFLEVEGYFNPVPGSRDLEPATE